MRTRANSGAVTWFEFGLGLFAMAVPIGVVLMIVAPVWFFHFLGVVIVGSGLIGAWVCALGLRLEHPERWHALKAWFGFGRVPKVAKPLPPRSIAAQPLPPRAVTASGSPERLRAGSLSSAT